MQVLEGIALHKCMVIYVYVCTYTHIHPYTHTPIHIHSLNIYSITYYFSSYHLNMKYWKYSYNMGKGNV